MNTVFILANASGDINRMINNVYETEDFMVTKATK